MDVDKELRYAKRAVGAVIVADLAAFFWLITRGDPVDELEHITVLVAVASLFLAVFVLDLRIETLSILRRSR